jgi:hypothetical protein
MTILDGDYVGYRQPILEYRFTLDVGILLLLPEQEATRVYPMSQWYRLDIYGLYLLQDLWPVVTQRYKLQLKRYVLAKECYLWAKHLFQLGMTEYRQLCRPVQKRHGRQQTYEPKDMITM